jgi:peptide/nickel transport system substrate-binding protein
MVEILGGNMKMARARLRLARLITIALAVGLVGAACGDDDDDPGAAATSATQAPTSQAAGDDTSTAPAPAGGTETSTAGPTVGGDFRLSVPADASGFAVTEARAFASSMGPVYTALYDTLMRWDDTSRSVVPQMAEGLTTTDHKVWEMKLRPGVTFTDGTPLDAEAVIYSMQLIKDTPSSLGAAAAAQITDMTAVDDLTVRFTLSEANPHFDINFTDRLGFVGSPTAIQQLGADFSRRPVAAGPFKMDEWVAGSHVRLVRNPDYWNAPRPYLDSFTAKIVSDVTQQVNVMKAGEADAIYAITAELVDRLQDELGFEIQSGTMNGGTAIVFNTQAPPFDDPALRLAVRQAVDLDDFNNAVYAGHAKLNPSPFSPDSPYYDASVEFPDHDPEAAQAAFDAYAERTGSPLKVTWLTTSSSTSRKTAEVMQAILATYGVEVTIDANDTAAGAQKVYAGDFQAVLWGLNMAGEPEPVISQFLASDTSSNISQYDNPEVAELLAAARMEEDDAERAKSYSEVARHLAEDMPFFIVSSTYEGLAVREGVGGVKLSTQNLLLADELTLS